jgi:hypothetical protein
MKKLALHALGSLIFISLNLAALPSAAQVSVTMRDVSAFTKELFSYQGARLLMGDNASTPLEQSVFTFSKPSEASKTDQLYLERFQRLGERWTKIATHHVSHEGLLSVWGTRKAFVDPDKDQSVDAFFVYSKHKADKTQTSVHLVISHKAAFYTISGFENDKYSQSSFSKNFTELPSAVKAAALKYWDSLDKE